MIVLLCCWLAPGCDDLPAAGDASIDAGLSSDAGRRDASAVPDAGGPDAAAPLDGGASHDAGAGTDAGVASDGGAAADAGTDAGTDAGMDAGMDAGTPARSDHHVHIDVDNFCGMTVSPTSATVPAGQTAYVDWHNHSRDYAVDVWMSYGGGYTDLATGATWDEPIGHCGGPSAHTEYADISTACSSFRFLIHCL